MRRLRLHPLFAVLAVLLTAAAAPPGRAVATTPAATAGDPTRTPGAPAYTVDLSSDATGAHWHGHERITFSNVSPDPLQEVYLRLWDNFRGGCANPSVRVTGLGTTQVTQATLLPQDTRGRYEVGCTALRVPLPHPLTQGSSGTVEFDLTIDVPDGIDRFGRDGSFSFIGNALPVLAVRDEAGWHLDPYSELGESFYGLSSDFAVTLDHPTDLLVPATGTAVDTPGEPGRTLTRIGARKVREFAWAAGPFSRIAGRSADGVRIAVYSVADITPKDAQDMLDLSLRTIDAHSASYGAYPYGDLALVLDNRFDFAGMEYPGFVLDWIRPSAVIHELAHQWWYGIVGDDQYRAPWLDESFTEYAMAVAMGDTGEGCTTRTPWRSADERLTNPMSYWDTHPDRYVPVIYDHGSCALHELRRLIGADTMAGLLRDYARAHWYGVSTTADFKAAAQAATPVDLTPFWREHRIG
ncbi:M1 family metallopeptidase [Streptomyces viridifaciens]|uniref:M1 family metallopeptidase n=1 Tax=Kitasatospora aureofaciens TaxID=1894 RepID=UPI000AFF006F|nr:M1 family metallopeptidase [Kitasatospora aureofaciens]UKZ10185.1 M1 family metallopeptidase [Streptomyces viridifaciens]